MSLPLDGFSVVLVARFNRRYHQVGPAIAAAFRSLGATVIPVEVKTRLTDRVLGRTLGRRLAAALRRRPDLVLSFKAGELEPELIGALRPGSSARWANWFPDGPQELDLSLRIGAGYDRSFLFDSGMVARHRALGRPAEHLGLGFDPALFRPVPDPGPPLPLVFVGSPEPGRDRALGAVADLGLVRYGPGRPEGPLFGDRLIRTLGRAAVGLNVHVFFGDDPATGRYGSGVNQRVYEIAGVGRCQLCDAKADLASVFDADREIVLYRSLPELREKAIALLADPARAAELGERGRKRALAEHTWAHRVRELVGRMFPVKISGFTIVKNAVTLDFPIEPAIRSILPLCDEVVVNVGRSDDGTLELVRGIADPRIRILETEWDQGRGSAVLREETDRAMRACAHPFGIYLQADEVLHEAGLPSLRAAVEQASRDDRIDGVAVRYRHIFGSADQEAVGRRWYRREVRAVRLVPRGRVHSFRDAQGFRVGPDDRRLQALVADAEVFHYGYLRSAAAMRGRRSVDQALRPDGRRAPADPAVLSWFPGIESFRGTHPAAAAGWVAAQAKDPDRRIAPPRWHVQHLRYAASNLFERLTGLRLFEFRNFDPIE